MNRTILSDNEKIVLFVGNLVPVKAPDRMLAAFAVLARGERGGIGEPSAARPQNPVLLIVGEGPMRRSLARQAARLGIADRVHFLGTRPHAEVALWMNAADCLCLPSRSEGMPNVVLEALASGLPVVATDAGACRSLLEGETASRIVTQESPAAGPLSAVEARLADAIREVLALEVDRPAMAARHASRWNWRDQAEAILQLMQTESNSEGTAARREGNHETGEKR